MILVIHVIVGFQLPGLHIAVIFYSKSSVKNERTSVVIEREDGLQILFRQIAGLLAKRIVCYVKEDDIVQQGEECGFIKFGSRLDIFLPIDTDIKVRLGDAVQGGISVVAEV